MNINSSYRKVWFARLISILGTGLTSFGVSVWVYTVTGKATPMVLILLFSILPAIFLAPFSGYLCDKYNRKAIIICADSIAALISVFIYICVSYYEFNYFVLCVFTFLDSCANFFDNNAYQASITTLVSPDEVKTANGMSQIIDSLDSIASPIVAGMLYPLIGLNGIIIIDLISYLVSLVILVTIDSSKFSMDNENQKKRNTKREILLGFKFIFSQGSLRVLLIYFTILNFTFNLATSLIEPFGLTLGNTFDLGIIKACGGLGILCGSLVVTFSKKIHFTYKTIVIGGLVAGIALQLMGFTHITCIVAIGRFSFSFVTPILNTVAGTLWMQETPRILQGRVFASRSMIARCFVPLSYVVVGPLVDIVLPKLLQSNLGLIINVVGTQALEYRLVFCGAGVLCVLITCCVAANTNFRKL